MNRKGFTLIELIVVVAIIGILAVIAIPAYIGQQKSATRTEAFTNLQNLRLLEEQYFAEHGCYYMDSTPTCTDDTLSGVTNIQAFLPAFRPGDSLNFTYDITTETGPGGGAASCFTATATGTGPRVAGEVYWINCNNIRNF
jgi:prepilin-type N-terminal cleavage/methylation domain-containing protein